MTDARSRPAEKDIEVRSLFATPVVIARAPMTEDDNARLAQTILARAAADAGRAHSNLLGWQSGDDLLSWGGAEGERVIALARGLADRLTADRAGNRVAVNWFINAWANVNRFGHANQVHAHPGALWSGCYYVDDGGCGADPALGGELEIVDPRGIAPAMYVPELTVALTGCENMGGSELIRPETGRLLLFPAWIGHGVRPYLGEATRISIAFNFAVAQGS